MVMIILYKQGEDKMRKLVIGTLLGIVYVHSADNVASMFEEGKAYGNIKYYYIQTDKQNNIPHKDTSANAHAIGGTLGFKTAPLYGLSAQATFMTTNGFGLDGAVDTSIIGRDNGVRLDNGNPSGAIAQKSFTVLGEAFVNYDYNNFFINYGRQVVKTPLIDAKTVRMLPSAVQGARVGYHIEDQGLTLEGDYLTHFKQRTSNDFINIVEHALGANTKAITGDTKGDLLVASLLWKHDQFSASAYDYYAKNFLNSVYANINYTGTNDNYTYNLGFESIIQRSIGTANINLSSPGSLTGGKKINTEAFSFKGDIHYQESSFMMGYTYISSDDSVHDSLVLPWDGTPLYTNMITSNDLFVSNYGKGLTADSIYIGGTKSFKFSYTQGYDFTGFKGIKTTFAYMIADNDKFTKGKQKDFNAVLSYKYDKHFSIALKGIFVKNNTSAREDGTISQLDDFQQYRVIANYRF